MTIADTTVAGHESCPACHVELTSQRGAQPWCGRCEWGLDRYEPDRRVRDLAFRWQDRAAFRLAYRQNLRQFRAVAAAGARRPSLSWESAFVVAVSMLMLALVIAIGAFGVYLTITTFFDFRTAGGVLLILIAVLLRPRFGRLSKRAYRLSPERAPELFRLIGDIAAAAGTKPPRILVVSNDLNAFTTSIGLRRRRVLGIGLPLWMSLQPQERVALLGHELAHFSNGDVRRGPLISLAFTTLQQLAAVTAPGRASNGFLAELFARVVLRTIHELLVLTQTAITALAMRSTQRAEYYADAIAVRVGGAPAVAGVMDVLVIATSMSTVLRSSLLRGENAQARLASVNAARDQLEPMLPGLRQLSLRDEASLFRSHPPSGLRARMASLAGGLDPQVVLTPARSAQIDAELAEPYRYVSR